MTLLLSYLLPVPLALLIWWLINRYTNYSFDFTVLATLLGVLILAMIIALGVYGRAVLFLEYTIKHLNAITKGDYRFRSTRHRHGFLSKLTSLLNGISDKFEQFTHSDEAELAVIKAEANRLRNVINSINDGVVALDSDAHIILFNKAAAKISGYGLELAAGQPISQILPLLKGNSLILNEWLNSVSGADIRAKKWENLRLKTKDGKTRVVDVEALYQGADPNGIRTLITFHDRTEAQELEDMKVDFVALAAHELRTPISVIRGYLEILEEELANQLTPQQQDFMQNLSVSASQLSGFINNILHVSRIEHGELNLKLEAVNWLELIKQAVTELQTKAQVQHKQINLVAPASLPQVAVDRLSIIEVINNLVDNAIKYSPSDTTVTLTLRQNGQTVETVVQDQGVGIPENAIDKLFTKFYRSHRTRSSHRGTGLGLYMSKSIVEAHGGSIWVHSKVGEGSTFGFVLPIYDEARAHVSLESNNKIIRGVHGWIKNHSLYRG